VLRHFTQRWSHLHSQCDKWPTTKNSVTPFRVGASNYTAHPPTHHRSSMRGRPCVRSRVHFHPDDVRRARHGTGPHQQSMAATVALIAPQAEESAMQPRIHTHAPTATHTRHAPQSLKFFLSRGRLVQQLSRHAVWCITACTRAIHKCPTPATHISPRQRGVDGIFNRLPRSPPLLLWCVHRHKAHVSVL